MPSEIQFTITEQNRLDKQCARDCPEYSRSFWENLISKGSVKINDSIITSTNFLVNVGDAVSAIIPDPISAVPKPFKMDLNIIFEDADILIINKPAGLTVHPAPGHYDDTLVNGLLAYCMDSLSGIGGVQRPGIVHRLDKDTSGLMVVAKNDKAHQKLSADFAIHAINRRYMAIVHGVMRHKTGTIDAPIGRDKKNRQKQAVIVNRVSTILRRGIDGEIVNRFINTSSRASKRGSKEFRISDDEESPEYNETSTGQGKHAITHYRIIGEFEQFSLCEFHLETGRTHQVRVHSAHIGHPIIGDELYGRKPKFARESNLEFQHCINDMSRQALHAYHLQLDHPISGESLEFQVDLPADMAWINQFIRAR